MQEKLEFFLKKQDRPNPTQKVQEIVQIKLLIENKYNQNNLRAGSDLRFLLSVLEF